MKLILPDSETGLGHSDIILLDYDSRTAVIIEAKKSQKESDMEKDCQTAQEQIKKQKYAEDNRFHGYEKVLCYGVAFFQKKALVKKSK
ncbi:MAG: PD-(D/E)XK nuclease domain-containing protein [Synergistaceae bacterium]|nr:PD-(D/E)XK nuclease domain-containing protein [Synergistaceae bacterium]MBQ7069279.1 PD-(D/E)XK nuclease domain-containing protein [Synergistaceae bacterium]MBR0076072.1 PD-(D/E)XK nuclease domain-containing protein [Synergistaceae bacterium]MBR0079034.1 PD-(D/E)XK nuclease domain-containing protein [Synergistaceae bacterium]MBR0233330.1 PD-(D/E)XK nuclease domain-containing protein [Synergistaceae bacterium]